MKYISITFDNGVVIDYPFIRLSIVKNYVDKKYYIGRELVITRPFGQLKRHIDLSGIETIEVYENE